MLTLAIPTLPAITRSLSQHPMDSTTLLLATLTAALAAATVHAWRLGNERRDVVLLGVFSGLLGAGALITAVA